MTAAVITIAHGRRLHLGLQREGLARCTPAPATHLIVAMADASIADDLQPSAVPTLVVELAADPQRLPLATARNLGARAALESGATTLIFLDVDCVPGEGLVAGYAQAAVTPEHANRLLCGPVTYLRPPPPGGYDLTRLDAVDDPHPARPAPPPGRVEAGGAHELFWSLSFAVSARTWQLIGGFHEQYSGYGAEDTDFGQVARSRGVELAWVGSARAYHQHHATSSPPIQHVDDVLRNGAIYRDRWGSWPMLGWLEAFERLGLVRHERATDEWRRA